MQFNFTLDTRDAQGIALYEEVKKWHTKLLAAELALTECFNKQRGGNFWLRMADRDEAIEQYNKYLELLANRVPAVRQALDTLKGQP